MSLINLSTSDGQLFQVSRAVCRMLTIIDTILQDLGIEESLNETLPVENVSGRILQLIINWAEHHQADPEPILGPADQRHDAFLQNEDDWDNQFFRQMDCSTLVELMKAADFLCVTRLHDMAITKVGSIMNQPIEEARLFLYGNEHTPEEKDDQIKTLVQLKIEALLSVLNLPRN